MNVANKKIGELVRDLFSLELRSKLSEHSDVLFLNYSSLKSAELTQLRKDLKASDASIFVTKNSYMKRVFEDVKKASDVARMIDGPTALVFIKDDPVVVSRALVDFAKAHESLDIRGGFLGERLLSLGEVKHIAKLSSKQAVYQQVASVLNAPVSKLAGSLNQILAKIAYALKAVSEKKEKK